MNPIPVNGRGFSLLVNIRSHPPEFIEKMGTWDLQYTQSICQVEAEIDGIRLFEMLGGTGDLRDEESSVNDPGD